MVGAGPAECVCGYKLAEAGLNVLVVEMRYYNEERLHSAPKYLRPVDYYRGNSEALLAERERKLREAAARRKEVNKWGDLTRTKLGYRMRAPWICPKMTEPIHIM